MLTRVLATKIPFRSFRKRSTASVATNLSESIYNFQIISIQTLSQPLELRHLESHGVTPPCRRHYPSKFLTVLHSLLHSEIPNNGRQDLCLQSCYLSSSMLKMFNAHALKVDSYEIFCMQSQPSRYQSRPLQYIHTWRSCSCADLVNASSTSRSTL